MNIKIDRKENTSYSYENIVDLIHESFQERIQQGLVFTSSRMSCKDFIEKYGNNIILVAHDLDSKSLVGVYVLSLIHHNDNMYGNLEHLAVASHYKRLGIGTKMLKTMENIVLENGGRYLTADTAVGAKSSVKWHLKNGFKMVGLFSFRSTDYYSYIFRKQLCHPSIWDLRIITFCVFIYSCLHTLIMRNTDGTLSKVGTLITNIKNIV